MNVYVTVVQIRHPFHQVMNQRHSEIPIQLNRFVLKNVLEGFWAIFGKNKNVRTRQVDTRAYEPNGVLMVDISSLFYFPQQRRVYFNLGNAN